MKHVLHVVGLPHAPTTKEHSSCAYTAKVYKFCKMMTKLGHHVIHYGVAGSNPPCEQHVTVLTRNEYLKHFGFHDYKKDYYPIKWSADEEYFKFLNTRVIEAIKQLGKPKQFLCLITGLPNRPIIDEVQNLGILPVEYGIGYYGTCANYRAFESYAHMANIYGRESRDPDGKFFDAVIPNYFDLEDFTPNMHPKGIESGVPYCLFVGRMIKRKGLEIAVEATKQAQLPLLLVGQGIKESTKQQQQVHERVFETTEGQVLTGNHIMNMGYADVLKRNTLMGNAAVLIAPTIYLEPFGGVAVEAQLCGTPVVTTDWGAFPETVEHGVTGFRCRTLEQFVWALKEAQTLERNAIAKRARRLYSLEKVGQMFEEWFDTLYTIWGEGWYTMKERKQLDWLEKVIT